MEQLRHRCVFIAQVATAGNFWSRDASIDIFPRLMHHSFPISYNSCAPLEKLLTFLSLHFPISRNEEVMVNLFVNLAGQWYPAVWSDTS